MACRVHACVIVQASASLMAEACRGKSREELLRLCDAAKDLFEGLGEDVRVMAELRALSSIKKFPARVRCALLPWEALQRCLERL